MSSSVKNRPSIYDDTGGSGSGSGDGDGECSRENDRNRRSTHDKKSKRVSLFRFRSARKQSNGGRSNRPSSSAIFTGGRLCICFKPTATLDHSPGESQASDPNSLEFNSVFMKGLIEKNDFWSKECNTHLDVKSISSSEGDSAENCR